MIDITIPEWNDITSYLNGYVLEKIIINGDSLIGINSNKEEFLLAKRRIIYWEAVPGSAYISISQLLDKIRIEIIRPNNIFNTEDKDKIIVEELTKIILLMNKDYS